MHSSISVLGAGSWGTSLAIQAARNGSQVLLWGHNPEHMAALSRERENKRYLPNFSFPDSLAVTDDIAAAVSFSSVILISVPSHAFKSTLILLKPLLNKSTRIAWATKGFDPEDGLLLSDVIEQTLPLNTVRRHLEQPAP